MEYYRGWTVRAYNIMMRYAGRTAMNADQAEDFGLAVLRGNVRNAGIKVAVEALRAAGWGVYEIKMAILDSKFPVDVKTRCLSRVKTVCNELDTDKYWRLGL